MERRACNLTDKDIENLANMLGFSKIETHVEHHEWIERKKKSEERCSSFREKIIEQTVGWGVITTIGFIGYLIATGIFKYIRDQL